MSKPASRNARAKGVERKVQQYLWPGSRFAGGAHRPAHEHEDLRGDDRDGRELWGEAKNWAWSKILNEGGPWAVLYNAFNQCDSAIVREHKGLPGESWPNAFAVLWPPGSRRHDQRLVMYGFPCVGLAVVTLEMFKRLVVDPPTFEEEGETDEH